MRVCLEQKFLIVLEMHYIGTAIIPSQPLSLSTNYFTRCPGVNQVGPLAVLKRAAARVKLVELAGCELGFP
jgi:hypothetical protein